MPHPHDPPPTAERPRSAPGSRDAAHPARAESAAGSGAASQTLPGKRPVGFLVLAVFLALLCAQRAVALMGSPAPGGAHGPALRVLEFVSLVCGVALVVGLWRYEPWVAAAVLGWAGALAARQALLVFGNADQPAPPDLWIEVTVGGIVPALVLLYVLARAPRSRAGPP